MRRLCLLLAALLAPAVLGACQRPTGPEATAPPPGWPGGNFLDAELGESFTLAVGGAARIEAADAEIRFIDVTEDSRCPVNVECVWAGQATVSLKVTQGDGSPQPIHLTISGGVSEPQPIDGYAITLVALNPYPQAPEDIARADYTATLVVALP